MIGRQIVQPSELWIIVRLRQKQLHNSKTYDSFNSHSIKAHQQSVMMRFLLLFIMSHLLNLHMIHSLIVTFVSSLCLMAVKWLLCHALPPSQETVCMSQGTFGWLHRNSILTNETTKSMVTKHWWSDLYQSHIDTNSSLFFVYYNNFSYYSCLSMSVKIVYI